MADKNEIQELIAEAVKAKDFSYSPYSKFRVGAAIRSEDGRIFRGCNVENASYPCGICAERCVISKAVSEGVRKFKALALASDEENYITPCGMCRQVIREFSLTIPIYCSRKDNSYKEVTLEKFLPDSFGPDVLQK